MRELVKFVKFVSQLLVLGVANKLRVPSPYKVQWSYIYAEIHRNTQFADAH